MLIQLWLYFRIPIPLIKKDTPELYFSSGEKIVKAELGNYNVFDFSNRTMYSYDVKLANMLDVSNPSVRSQLGMEFVIEII